MGQLKGAMGRYADLLRKELERALPGDAIEELIDIGDLDVAAGIRYDSF